MSDTPTTINRTLILGLGDTGSATIEAFHTRLCGLGWLRGRDKLPIATLTLTTEPAISENVTAVQVGAPDAGRPEIWTALGKKIDLVTAEITAALAGISQISSDIGGNSLRSTQVDVYLVASLDDPMAGILVDVAYLARHLIDRRLNARSRVSGLLLFPSTLTCDDPKSVLARTYAAVKTVDAYMSTHDGYRRSYGNGSVIDGWGPVFDGQCFLVGSLNRDGLCLSQPDAHRRLVTELLLQLTISAVGQAVQTAEPAWRHAGSRPSYAGLGIAQLVWPAQAVHERLARRLARGILETWIADPPNKFATSRVVAFLADNDFNSESIREQILPGYLLAEAGIGHPLKVELPWENLNTLRDGIDELVARRLETLNAQREALENAAERLANDLAQFLGEQLAERIDQPQPADLPSALALVRVLRDHLRELEKREAQHAATRWEAFQALSDEIDQLGKRLAQDSGSLADRYPTTLRGSLDLVLKPHQWWSIWHTWQAVQQTKMTYIALQQRQVELTIEILQSDLLTHYLQVAVSRVERSKRRLTALLEAVETAANALRQDVEEEMAPLLGLERSIQIPRQMDYLYDENVDDLATELSAYADSEKPLLMWLEQTPEATRISASALAFARRRLRSISHITVGQAWVAQNTKTDQRHAELEALQNAAVPFLTWEETALRAREGETIRQTKILGLPATDFELLEDEIESMRRSTLVVPTAAPYQIVAITLVQGIPLASIPIIQEAASSYSQAPEPALLHGDPDNVNIGGNHVINQQV